MWLQVVGFLLFIVYVILPLAFRYSANFQRLAIFLPWSNGLGWPIHYDFNRPETYGLRGTRTFFLESEPGISIGLWHILPKSLIDKVFYHDAAEESLSRTKHPIVLYLHGNSGSRATPHRRELYKLLQSLDYHVIAVDYRSFADSTCAVLSEKAAVQDALTAYQYIRKSSNYASNVIIWGHSVGSGIAAGLTSQLCWVQQPPDRLILESPFNNIRDEIRHHPLAFIYKPLRIVDHLFTDNLLKNDLALSSDQHIVRIDCPILMLHAKDDMIVPVCLFYKLYKAAVSERSKDWPPVDCVQFKALHKYGHENIYKAPELPSIIQEFVGSNNRNKDHREQRTHNCKRLI